MFYEVMEKPSVAEWILALTKICYVFRLTPMYMLILGTYSALFVYWGSGPMWPYQTGADPNCKKYWWTNLLYINNFVSQNKMVRLNFNTEIRKWGMLTACCYWVEPGCITSPFTYKVCVCNITCRVATSSQSCHRMITSPESINDQCIGHS